MHAPGSPMENFCRAAATLEAQSMDDLLVLAQQHGIELLGPVPELV